jgi:hypothetical protein
MTRVTKRISFGENFYKEIIIVLFNFSPLIIALFSIILLFYFSSLARYYCGACVEI